jgi:hypothetical protein
MTLLLNPHNSMTKCTPSSKSSITLYSEVVLIAFFLKGLVMFLVFLGFFGFCLDF